MRLQISPKPKPRVKNAQTSVTEAQYAHLRRLADEHETTISGLLFAVVEELIFPRRRRATSITRCSSGFFTRATPSSPSVKP